LLAVEVGHGVAGFLRLRAAGNRHNAASRHLFNRMLGTLHHCLTTRQTYDEQRAFPTGPVLVT